MGGEEFLIIARNSARADATILPERIRGSVEAHLFNIGEAEPLRCNCSIGFSVFPLLPDKALCYTWEQIVDLADSCLYAAKRNGRNAWVGVIPNASSSGENLPSDPVELLRIGMLPVVSTLPKPILWK